MRYRNLTRALAGIGVAGVILGAWAPIASADAQAVHRASANCASPLGQKINISWGDGNVSTTVYYNNHCSQKRAIVES